MGNAFIINLTDNSPEFINGMEEAAVRALEKCGLFCEGEAKKLCPVDTGNLRNSITHTVDTEEPAGYIGTNVKYGPYVECGTGKYYPGGRKTPWVYKDDKGNWHITNGQRAQPFLKPAIENNKDQIMTIIEGEMKRG